MSKINIVLIVILTSINQNYGTPARESLSPPQTRQDDTDNLNYVSHNLVVSHFDCSLPSNSQMYSLSEVSDCKITETSYEKNNVLMRIYQKNPLFQIIAYAAWVNTQHTRYWCGMYSHSSISRTTNMITRPYKLDGKIFKEMMQTERVEDTFAYPDDTTDNDYTIYIPIVMNQRKQTVITKGQSWEDTKEIDCDGRGWVDQYSYQTYLTRFTLTFNQQSGAVMNQRGQTLSCPYSQGYCSSSAQDNNVYSWDTQHQCILESLGNRNYFTGIMLKWNKKYIVINHPDVKFEDDDPVKNIKLQINPRTVNMCKKTYPGSTYTGINLHETDIDNVYIEILAGGYNLITGDKISCPTRCSTNPSPAKRMIAEDQLGSQGFDHDNFDEEADEWIDNMINHPGTSQLIKSRTITECEETNLPEGKNSKDRENCTPKSSNNSKLINDKYFHHTSDVNVRINFVTFQTHELMRNAERSILQKLCDIERKQILTVLQLAPLNSQLAGYILTGNRSTFLHVENAIAYVYSCQLKFSNFMSLPECYDSIPIQYKGETKFVNPISRVTLDYALRMDCTSTNGNIFMLNHEDPNSWYRLSPTPSAHPPLLSFAPHDVSAITSFEDLPNAQLAGLYSDKELAKFWLQINAGQRRHAILQDFTENLDSSFQSIGPGSSGGYSGNIGSRLSGKQGRLYLDNLISNEFFEFQFISHFGIILYYFQQVSIWYAGYLLAYAIFSVICCFIRITEIHTITQGSWGLTKSIIAGVGNIFVTNISANAAVDRIKQDTDWDKFIAKITNELESNRQIPDIQSNYNKEIESPIPPRHYPKMPDINADTTQFYPHLTHLTAPPHVSFGPINPDHNNHPNTFLHGPITHQRM